MSLLPELNTDHQTFTFILTAAGLHPISQKRKRTTLATLLEDDGITPVSKKERRRPNWQHPLLWAAIDSAARQFHFESPQAIVSCLQTRYSNEGSYAGLVRSTVDGWIDKSEVQCCWKKDVLDRVEFRSCWIAGGGKPMVLDSQPEMVADIFKTLRSIRVAGLPVNAPIARNLILGFIAQRCPSLLDNMPRRDGSPIFSIWITPTFLKRELNWVVRTGTKALQKLPPFGNWCVKRHSFEYPLQLSLKVFISPLLSMLT
jgi:hypothetical protein